MNRLFAVALMALFLTTSLSRAQDKEFSPKSVDLGPLGEYFTVLEIHPYGGPFTSSGTNSMLLQLQARKDADTSEFAGRFKLGAFDAKNHLFHTAVLTFEHTFPLERSESINASVDWPFMPETEVPGKKLVIRRVKQR